MVYTRTAFWPCFLISRKEGARKRSCVYRYADDGSFATLYSPAKIGLLARHIYDDRIHRWTCSFCEIISEKEYRIESVVLIALGLFLYFFQQITKQLSSFSIPTSGFELYWPYVLIAVSLLLLFLKGNNLYNKKASAHDRCLF